MPISGDYLIISSGVPSEEASPPPKELLHGASSEREGPSPEPPFILLSKSPVDKLSSRFPKRGPYGKRCPSPEPFLHILQGR